MKLKYFLKYEYGITLEQYEAMADAQGRACAICGKVNTKGYKILAVDHDHTTGKIRGLLCTRCNTGLGQFYDNPESLKRAASYLESHRLKP